jgi:chromosome segregation ATPase
MYVKSENFLRPLNLCRAAGAVAVLVLGAVSVNAQQMPEGHPGGMMAPKSQGGQGSGLMQQVQQKRAEIEQLNQQLMVIQENTIEANPELATQRDELISFVDEKMAETGYDAEAARGRIEELQGEMQSGDLSAEEEQQHRQQLRQEMTSMQQAQGQVMQDEEFQAKRQALNENLVAAMQEQNPKTDELISQLQTAQQEYQQLAQQAMQQRGGGMGMGSQQGGGSPN